MKTSIFFLTLFFLSISLIFSKMPVEDIEKIRERVTKKLTMEDLKKKKQLEKEKIYKLKDQIPYDPAKIDSIIDYMAVPQTFNFLVENNITAKVKDQGSCGCCWSMAATTALAYRYIKQGIDVDLSPQDGLSCYIRDCESGNYLIDSAMNLVKNGTVTEACEPFVSDDGRTIPQCPTTCADGSEFKRYYAKEVYMTEDYYSKDTFYDIVTLIIDQLNNYGPVVTGIDVYNDFMDWHRDTEKCKSGIYSYDGVSELAGGHAVALVGYGKIGSKYYWLLQNSWSEYVCDKGFVKVEMGQIGVENVAFVTPYLPNKESKTKNVNLKFESIDETCSLKVSSDSETTADWENEVEISFKNKDSEVDRTFNIQCGLVSLESGKKPACYYEYFNGQFMHKGTYEFTTSQSLGTENTFNLDDSFKGKNFYFYGSNYLYNILDQKVYVSQEGSSVVLYHDFSYGIESNFPPIWANQKAEKPLSHCQAITLGEDTLAVCKLTKEEANDFNKQEELEEPIVYSTACGYKESSGMIGYKLDTTKYPIFKIKDIYVPNGIINPYTFFTVVMDVEGSVSDFKESSVFIGFINIEIGKQNFTTLVQCFTGLPEKSQKDYRGFCFPQVGGEFTYNEIYLHNFALTYDMTSPFEVYIKNPLQAKKGDVPIPEHNSSSLVKVSALILGLLLLL